MTSALADRYRIVRELGSGGMASVYLARDVRHGRELAVKVLKPDVAESLGRERFVREIRLAAGLTHPHILPLYDSGEATFPAAERGTDQPSFLYLVTPVMRGQTLRDLLTGIPPFTAETVEATIAKRFIHTRLRRVPSGRRCPMR